LAKGWKISNFLQSGDLIPSHKKLRVITLFHLRLNTYFIYVCLSLCPLKNIRGFKIQGNKENEKLKQGFFITQLASTMLRRRRLKADNEEKMVEMRVLAKIPMKTFPIKKIINTELFIDGEVKLYIQK